MGVSQPYFTIVVLFDFGSIIPPQGVFGAVLTTPDRLAVNFDKNIRTGK